MSTSREFVEYIAQDIFSSLDDISVKRLFSGYGIYRHGIIFAIVIDDQLYLKVDDSNVGEFKKMESEPFTYLKKGKEVSLPYWSVSEDVLEDRDELLRLVDLSFEVGKNSKK